MISYPNVKVNLGLSVLRRRPDGYHDLETIFVPYSGIHDTLEITPLVAPLGQGGENCPAAQDPSHLRWAPPSYVAEGGTSFQTTAPAE